MADFLTNIGRALGISNREGAAIGSQIAQGNYIQAGLTTLGSLGGEGSFESQRSDVSGPPAGVDSPATVSRVSQTSQVPLQFREAAAGGGIMGGQGTSQAFIGGLGIPGLIGTAARTLSRPGVGGLIGGLGAGAVVDFFIDEFGREKKLVITRKLQRDIKKIFVMTGGDVRTTSDIYRSATGRFIPEDKILKILFKTFKNQGPYVTKAAVRKTRSTIRKMETLCDLKDRLCPPKRAAPRRRTMGSTTKVLQVK
jgi:hypothetical protein